MSTRSQETRNQAIDALNPEDIEATHDDVMNWMKDLRFETKLGRKYLILVKKYFMLNNSINMRYMIENSISIMREWKGWIRENKEWKKMQETDQQKYKTVMIECLKLLKKCSQEKMAIRIYKSRKESHDKYEQWVHEKFNGALTQFNLLSSLIFEYSLTPNQQELKKSLNDFCLIKLKQFQENYSTQLPINKVLLF